MDCVVLIGRYREPFKDRSITFMDEEGNVEHVVRIPSDVILCDVCGNPILSHLVPLLVLDGEVWGVVCSDCIRRYHRDKPVLTWSEYADFKEDPRGGER